MISEERQRREEKAREIRNAFIDKCKKDYDLLMTACENISFYHREQIENAKNQPHAIIPMQFILSELSKHYPNWCVCKASHKTHCMIIHHLKKFSDRMFSKDAMYIRQYNRFLLEVERLKQQQIPCVQTPVYISDCCGAPIIDDTDFCSECKEHCEAVN